MQIELEEEHDSPAFLKSQRKSKNDKIDKEVNSIFVTLFRNTLLSWELHVIRLWRRCFDWKKRSTNRYHWLWLKRGPWAIYDKVAYSINLFWKLYSKLKRIFLLFTLVFHQGWILFINRRHWFDQSDSIQRSDHRIDFWRSGSNAIQCKCGIWMWFHRHWRIVLTASIAKRVALCPVGSVVLRPANKIFFRQLDIVSVVDDIAHFYSPVAPLDGTHYFDTTR